MAAGTTSYLNNAWLNTIDGSGTAFNVSGLIYVQLHTATGSPGAAGTSNVSSTTTRQSITFSVSGGVLTNATAPQWLNWAGTNGETLGYVSFWDAASGGNCLWWAQLSANYVISTTDTFTLSTATLTIVNAS